MSPTSGSGRRRSRQAALQVLYASDLGPTDAKSDEVFSGVADHFELPEHAAEFARELVAGVSDHREELDGHLERVARNWRVERMAVVDRNVLRLAAFELLHSATPSEVVIDEAVELARRFGGDQSTGFVNGVLDRLAGERQAPAVAQP